MAKKKNQSNSLNSSLARASKMHVVFAVIFAVQIMVYDAWQLVTPDVVLKRWLVAAAILLASIIVWYMANARSGKTATHNLLWSLIAVDIVAISFLIYMSRGMASRAILLYSIPIITSAILLKRSAIYLTAGLSAVAYIVTAVAYFVLNFNEGYKIELYGEVIFYSAGLFVIAGLASSVVKAKGSG